MPGHPEFYRVLDEMRDVHARKSADYGSGKDPLANCRSSAEFGIPPWVGVMIRINDKIQRIKSYTETGTLEYEGVEDALLDLANYAAIALVLFRETKVKDVPATFAPPEEAYRP